MRRDYNEWLENAKEQKEQLDRATAEGNAKDVIYYRGKYLFALKQAYKLDPDGIVPSSVTKYDFDVDLDQEIKTQLSNHQNQIDASIRHNKNRSSIKRPTLTSEFGLKIRRLATRVSQANFATNASEKKEARKEIAKDAASLAGTVAKAPVMVAAKVTSAVGPLAIMIAALPFTVLSSLLSATIDVFNGKTPEPSDYMNTPVTKLSVALQDGVKKLSTTAYETVGRI